MSPSTTPKILLPSVWPLPISLATTFGISVDYFSSPYLDVSVQAVPHTCLFDSACADRITPAGFPHSDIPGSQLICSSPRLFAAYHVLLRLLMPRHSPCALLRLTSLVQSSARRLRRLCCPFPLCLRPARSKYTKYSLAPGARQLGKSSAHSPKPSRS